MNSDLVCFNVSGETFQTTKHTLSRYPGSFFARLVNGELPSEKDETGAILIDRSYEHFDTILDYLRTGIVNFDRNEKAMNELYSEASFYKIQPLVEEILKAVTYQVIVVGRKSGNVSIGGQNVSYIGCLEMSDDNEVFQALSQKIEITTDNSDGFDKHYITSADDDCTWMNIESTLEKDFGFEKDDVPDRAHSRTYTNGYWKFLRAVPQ
ncbi:BTB/POZ domain-containing protein [Ditylenchus destructor]|nr:BTB/POZ domain-containing protein [Ditylenchus destructor]